MSTQSDMWKLYTNHRLTMSTQSDMWKLCTNRPTIPTFDPGLDVATVVFSHVQCVKTRHSLALVSKLWRDASKPAAAYPLRFNLDAFPSTYFTRVIGLLDNDEALSLPYERVVGLLGENAEYVHFVCNSAARRGSVRLLKWARVNNLVWSTRTCSFAAEYGHLPALKYLHANGCPWTWDTFSSAAGKGHLPVLKYSHENGCPWDSRTFHCAAHHGHLPALQYLHENGCPWGDNTCRIAAYYEHWNCLKYAVDNKAPEWERYGKKYAEYLR